jgi:hypothetical protein
MNWPGFVLLPHGGLDPVAPLGLRFLDTLSDRLVTEGLRVSVFPEGEPARRRVAMPNASGGWVVHGLRDAGAAGRGARFVVEVVDGGGRFLATRFLVAGLGRFAWKPQAPAGSAAAMVAGSPSEERKTKAGGEPWSPVPLYSAPSRAVPGATAVVRAELLHDQAGKPAAWAVLDALIGDRRVRGVADARGKVGLFFPYHPFPKPSVDGGMPPLSELQWTLSFEAFHSPSREPDELHTRRPGAPFLPLDTALQQVRVKISTIPAKRSDQGPRRRPSGRSKAPEPDGLGEATYRPDATATLRFGRELILQGARDTADRRLLLSEK